MSALLSPKLRQTVLLVLPGVPTVNSALGGGGGGSGDVQLFS